MNEEELKQYALFNKIELSSKKSLVKLIIKGLNNNKEKHGEYYCPCRVVRTEQTVCPCTSCLKDVEENGSCHCNLFVKR